MIGYKDGLQQVGPDALLSKRLRREAAVFAAYRRCGGREPQDAAKQEELLRHLLNSARCCAKGHIQAQPANTNWAQHKAVLTLEIWNQFRLQHKYLADGTFTFNEFDSALWNDGTPALVELLPGDAPITPAANPAASDSAESKSVDASSFDWSAIRIVVLSDHSIQVFRNDKSSPSVSYEEFGLTDSRNEKPNQAWERLIEFAKNSGVIESLGLGKYLSRLQKDVQALRKKLKEHFHTESDPIKFEQTKYRTRFKIELGRHFYSA